MSVICLKNAKDIDLRKKGNTTILTVNDHEIKLNRRHPITVSTAATNEKHVLETLRNGHFVIEDYIGCPLQAPARETATLLEYRSNDYNGFIQNEEFLSRFANDYTLGKRSNMDIDLPQYGKGGIFNITTGFTWSMFSRNLVTTVNIDRQICANGMVAKAPMFQRQVPLINLYDHHLDIAASQLIDITQRHLMDRLDKMGREHATIREVNLVHTHIERRLKNVETPKLQKLFNVTDLDMHEYYHKTALETGVAQTLPSTMSRFDLWNIVTETNSHTEETSDSLKNNLDRIATGLVFPKEIVGVVNDVKITKSTFGSPEQAFFG